MLVLATALASADNRVGLWTFLVLFAARISAKLNVYLGVPNLSDELMPEPVRHLKSYFAKRAMNFPFPGLGHRADVRVGLLDRARHCHAGGRARRGRVCASWPR